MVWFSKVKNINWTAHAAFSPTVTGVAFQKSGGMTHPKTTTVANKVFPSGLAVWMRLLWKQNKQKHQRQLLVLGFNSEASCEAIHYPRCLPNPLNGDPGYPLGQGRHQPCWSEPLVRLNKFLSQHQGTASHTMHMCRMHPPEPFCPPR